MDDVKSVLTHVKHHALPPLTDDDNCGIGQYANTPLKDVPFSFFEWMVHKEIEGLHLSRSKQWVRVIQYIKSHANK